MSAIQVRSLGEALPAEQARCRELLEVYLGLPNGVGAFGAAMIRQSLAAAEQAAVSGDIGAMLRAYERLRGHE